MTTYDRSILLKHADGLYSQAATILQMYGVLGAIIGGLAANFAGMLMFIPTDISEQSGNAALIVGALVGALIGATAGRARGFHLKLEAQRLLAQAAIEVRGEETVALLREIKEQLQGGTPAVNAQVEQPTVEAPMVLPPA